MRRLIVAILLLALTVVAENRYVYDDGALFTPVFQKFIEVQAAHIEDVTDIKILVVTGPARGQVALRSNNMIGVHIENNEITLVTTPDLEDLISDVNESFFVKEGEKSLKEGEPRAAMEFLFINIVDLIARENDLSMDALLVSPRDTMRVVVLVFQVLLLLGFCGAVYLLMGNSSSRFLSSESFGGPLFSRQTNFNGSFDQ